MTDISDLLRREGGNSNDPADAGGRTNFGISEKSNPEAWKDGKITEAEAREIYLTKYVKAPGFDKIAYPKLQAQLIDFGVNSGPHLAIQKLQALLNVEADGVLGPQTLAAILVREERELVNLLVGERIKMLARLVQKRPSNLKFLFGWVTRSLEFLIA